MSEYMLRARQRTVVVTAVLSVTVSCSMVVVTFAAPELPIWPIITSNWLLFWAVTALAGNQVSLLEKWEGISRTNHNIWRVVIFAFSGCGFIAIANGATIV